MKKIMKIFLSIFIVFVTSSCSFVDKIIGNSNSHEEIDSKTKESIFNISIDYNDSQYPNSIKLLNKAFNKEENNNLSFDFDKTNFDNKDNSYLYDVTKNVKSLPYNNYTTPSVGNIRALVIPIQFIDAKAKEINDKDVVLDSKYYSVSDYYYQSSYGKLNMKFDIMNWFTCEKESNYYKNYRRKNSNEDTDGVDLIINEALAYLSNKIDLSIYDENNDGIIDALYLIYSKNYDPNDDFWWAYQYYDSENKKYDNKSPYSYIFASFNFLFENDSLCNPTTYIHETGHLLGLEDYYDYDTSIGTGCNTGGMGGADMMDTNIGDHNTFSKLLTGWINNPLIIDTSSSITIDLKPSVLSDQCIILTNSFDSKKGIFQEYFIIEYYVNKGINSKMGIYKFNGIRILHINATLKSNISNGYTYEYFAYDNSYTSYNLIDIIIDSQGNSYSKTNSSYTLYTSNDLFIKDESLLNAYYNGYRKTLLGYEGKKLNYSIYVENLTDEYATIKISKK